MEFEERYGWTATLGSAPMRELEANRHPALRLEKGELWAETHGEPGIDPQIMYERCLIEALRLELSQLPEGSAEYAAVSESLRRAQMEERISQQMRREAAEAAAAGEI